MRSSAEGVLTENPSASKSCCFPHVPMMKTTDFRQLDHLPHLRSLYSPGHRGIAVQ